MNFNKTTRAQGAIEYLLLLAAAIIVVSIVVSFMASSLGPPKDAGDEGIYSYLCSTLDSNTAECTCYIGDNSNNYFDTLDDAEDYCCNQDKSILKKKWICDPE